MCLRNDQEEPGFRLEEMVRRSPDKGSSLGFRLGEKDGVESSTPRVQVLV